MAECHVLTLNAGSSSIKFAVFAITADGLAARMRGQVEGLGARPNITATGPDGADLSGGVIPQGMLSSHDEALALVLELH